MQVGGKRRQPIVGDDNPALVATRRGVNKKVIIF